jgi:hypothetical protein
MFGAYLQGFIGLAGVILGAFLMLVGLFEPIFFMFGFLLIFGGGYLKYVSSQTVRTADDITGFSDDKKSDVELKKVLYEGDRDTQSNDYRLFLCKKYGIERNDTLDIYSMNGTAFETLNDAIQAANETESRLINEKQEKLRLQNVDYELIKYKDENFVLYKNALGEWYANIPGKGKMWFSSKEACYEFINEQN